MLPLKYSLTGVLAILLLLAGDISDAKAQSGRITGSVTDMATGEDLPGANIMIAGASRGAAADLDGTYTILSVPAGEHNLIASYVGYERIERTVSVEPGEELRVDFEMEWAGVTGEEVVITAQAAGQVSAINQQLASKTISNIVSSDRIQELPDVNAAESIGRLPGISIQRSGGEANKVAIRGLSPKYNNVTVNGVRIPSVDTQDRSVDLGLVSSNMLDGIEVTKALTPDMDADAIGGSVDLRLRNAPDDPYADLQVFGGYTALQKTAGNYRIIGSAGNRFFGDQLGVIVGFNADEYDRSADRFNGSYELMADPQNDNVRAPTVTSLNLQENYLTRRRLGGNALVDYRLPHGSITWNAFYNALENDGFRRVNAMSVDAGEHRYSMSDFHGDASVFTTGLNTRQDFDWLYVDAGAALSRSTNETPENYYWEFLETSAFDGSYLDSIRFVPPQAVPPVFNNDVETTYFNDLSVRSSDTWENEGSFTANARMPYSLGSLAEGYFQIGGKYRRLERAHDVEEMGYGLYYGGGQAQDARDRVADALPDLGLEAGMFRFPLTHFQSDYSRDNFLNDEYPLGYTLNGDDLMQVTEVVRPLMNYFNQASLGSDYSGEEEYRAAYAMTEIDVGQWLTFMPGFRWESEYTKYDAKFVIGAPDRPLGPDGEPDVSFRDTTATREAQHLLPMVHLQLRPTEWLNLRLAYTHSLSRPNFRQFAPITFISQWGTSVTAPNTQLRPARSRNYDASLSIYRSSVGLITVSGFYKEIEDLVWGVNFPLVDGQNVLPELHLPNISGVPRVSTSLNNTFPATVKGIEFDWQTSFWYLPSFLKGLVLSLNYTLLDSETRYPQFHREQVPIVPRPRRPPFTYDVISDTSRVGRMPDQPSSIANVTLGYDYEGFSIRASYLYQSDIMRSLASNPSADTFTRDYYRFDIAVKQALPYGLLLMANFNNINNRADLNYQSSMDVYPTNIEYYGFTMDVGVRYTLR